MNEQDDELNTPGAESEYDVMEPWANDGPPPLGEWREDIPDLAYESQTTPLISDEEGDASATLVRYSAHRDPRASHGVKAFPSFITLYPYGRNDRFFQTQLVQATAETGCAFYTPDLRKYGRSLCPWQQIGYVDDLSIYDREIGEASSIMHAKQGHLPLVLVGHSTGGFIVTLWARRHPGAVAGLILNSPWLKMHTMANLRPVVQPILGRIASCNPKWEVPFDDGLDFYGRSLLYGRQASELPIPEGTSKDDPVVTGWGYVRAWKRPEFCLIPTVWLDAIMVGHETIEKDVCLTCSVFSVTSTASYFESEWCEKVFTSDIVLDVEIIREHSSRFADQVTTVRFPGKYDLFPSDPDVREKVYDMMKRWISAFVTQG